MGYLYLARAEGPGGFERLAALKMIHEHLSREPAFVEMFLEEARIAARIHHPNVITVYEIGEHAGQYFIAMDYIHGETLYLTLCRRWKTDLGFPFDIAAHIVANAAEGLHQAHELCDPNGQPWDVVHRDMTPGNIMIGYDGTVRVMDFGIAKAADQLTRTAPGTQKGKAPYMAPEQIRDQPIDRRVDIFALGIVLWETTIGRYLFKGSNDLATITRITSGEVPKPSAMREGYPVELERIVLKALAMRREDRYPTARAMAEDLRLFLASHARPVSAVDVEQFMRTTFPDRYAARLSMEKLATAPEPRPQSNERPSQVRPTVAKQLEALIFEELADGGLEITAQITPPQARRDTPTNPERAAAFVEELAPARSTRTRTFAVTAGSLGLALIISLAAFAAWPKKSIAPPPQDIADTTPRVRVAMTFDVTPPGATIQVDGVVLDGTFVADRSARTYEVKVSAPNYQPAVLHVVGDRSQNVEVALKPFEQVVEAANVADVAEKKSEPPKKSPHARRKPVKGQKLPDGLVDEGEL